MILFVFVSLFTCQLVRVNAAVNYASNGCVGDNGNYTQGSLYETNLNLLFTRLSSQASIVKFFNSTTGVVPNKVYGLFICREDLSQDVCTQCVADAAKRLVQNCPLFGEAIIWYDECMLRYANHSFFSLYEVLPSARLWSTTNVSNFVEFAPVFAKIMNGVIRDAAFSTPSKHFATREANVTLYDTLYSLAQCTPDLDGQGCNICLKAALVVMNNCCKGRIRAVSFLPSCQLKYDMRRFYNHTEIEELIPSPSQPNIQSIHPEKRLKASTIAGIAVATSAGIGLLLVGIWLCTRHKATKTSVETAAKVKSTRSEDGLGNEDFIKYDLLTLMNATGEFSVDNKVGEGGFGVVYKGTLKNGQEVAIKKLSGNSGQGPQEFMIEAHIVAKLQHRNLLKVLGFCSEGQEKLLVYEFMPNTSLDRFLFDPKKRALLKWETRYKIIMGITRGLQYLHEDSRLTVIHRDLKTSNILLDKEMYPKIADFGLAKLFGGDEKIGNTSRIAGTHGYMAPEYIYTGEYSKKSDVYSFGVIVLEIISGRKNKIFRQSSQVEDLVIQAWSMWNEGQPFKLVDPALYDDYSKSEVLRCIEIGILCVQENAMHRPTMAMVGLMLTGSIDIPLPSSKPSSWFQDSSTPINDHNNKDSTDEQSNNSHNQSTTSVSLYTDVEQDLYPR